MNIDDEQTPRQSIPLWQLLAKGVSGDLRAQREIARYYRAETFARPDYDEITRQAEMWARFVIANGKDYADVPALIDALSCRYDQALYEEENLAKANTIAVEMAALADLLSEMGNNSAIEDFGICVDFPSDQVRREASIMKEHWMRSQYCLSQIVFSGRSVSN